LLSRPPATATPLPYTTLFRAQPTYSGRHPAGERQHQEDERQVFEEVHEVLVPAPAERGVEDRQPGDQHLNQDAPHEEPGQDPERSEEHTSELQSRENLVCRLL